MEVNESIKSLENQKLIKDLSEHTKNVDQILMETCSILGWDLEKTVQNREPYVTCPFNQSHQVPERSIEKHLQKCEWKTLGYTDECVPLPESSLPLESPSTIRIDMTLQHQILQEAKHKNPSLKISLVEKFTPKTSDRFFSDFTSDERIAIYDYVIAKTIGPDTGDNITTDICDTNNTKEKEQNKAIEELLAAERNLKRRRARYRGVHTNKKSHTEIMKEVIEQQMEMLKEHISEKFNVDPGNDFSSNIKSEKRKLDSNIKETSGTQSHIKKDRTYSRDVYFKSDKDYSRKKHTSQFKNNKESDSYYRKHNQYEKSRDEYNNRGNFNRSVESNYLKDKSRYKNDFIKEKHHVKSNYEREKVRDENSHQSGSDSKSDLHSCKSNKREYQNNKSRHTHEVTSENDLRDKDHKRHDVNNKHKHKSSRKHKRSRSKSREKHKKSKRE